MAASDKAKDKAKEKDAAPKTREEALAQALKDLDKKYGNGTIMRLGDATANMNIEVIPTGILSLDLALGVGGLPRGRIIELYGPESSGKTTVSLHMIAEAQRRGGYAAFIDAEHALDPVYAKRLGVDIDNLLVSQPDSGDQALEIVEALVRSGAIDIIVIDSVAALVPQAELDGEMGQSQVGLHARMMSQAMRKLTAYISKSRTVAVFINQVREKVGTMYGNPEVTTGGRALKFFSSVRIEVRRSKPLNSGKEQIGAETKATIKKNKVAPPFKIATFEIRFGEGVSREGSIIDIATALEVLQKSGSWYSYNGERLGQGKDKIKEILKEKPELYQELEGIIRSKLAEAVSKIATADAAESDDSAADSQPIADEPSSVDE